MSQAPGQPPRRPIVVRQLGRADHSSMAGLGTDPLAQMMGATPQDAGTMRLDPAAFNGAPPWVLGLLNHVLVLEERLAVMTTVLQQRGLVTEQEMERVRLLLAQAQPGQFDTVAKEVQDALRRANPAPRPAADPRQSPGVQP